MPRRSRRSGVHRGRTSRSRLRQRTSGRAWCGSRSSSRRPEPNRCASHGADLDRAGSEAAAFRADDRSLGEDRGQGQRPRGRQGIFVTHLQLPKPGKYWLLAEPVGGRKIQEIGTVEVKQRTAAPDFGEAALPSKTPTLATATLAELSTSRVPDPELHRSSVAAALADHAPFVVVFATPKYCRAAPAARSWTS